ncbi:MAG: coenzyme A pyrophosphatase [Flavobacterium sp.]|nr:MAG: coenzyme A pyrophosphatase [Flavobacterium sp.]
MDFQEFENKIVKITKMKLPGESVQFKMAPMERLAELKRIAYKKNTARKAGVLVLFYPSEKNETHLALILRKTYKGVHSAQIGFPGGKYEDEDATLKVTALRETEEEIGVFRDTISVLKKLTEVYIPPSNFFVQPYLGITSTNPIFKIQEDEVEELLEVSLAHFMDDSIKTIQVLSTSYAKNIEVPAFMLNNHLVWGATAMMLNEVREMLKELL